MLRPGGLSALYTRRVPPIFCASAGVLSTAAASSATATQALRNKLIPRAPRREASPVEPHILKAPAVVDAVDHDRQPLDRRMPARCSDVVEDDRPRAVLLQLLVD